MHFHAFIKILTTHLTIFHFVALPPIHLIFIRSCFILHRDKFPPKSLGPLIIKTRNRPSFLNKNHLSSTKQGREGGYTYTFFSCKDISDQFSIKETLSKQTKSLLFHQQLAFGRIIKSIECQKSKLAEKKPIAECLQNII